MQQKGFAIATAREENIDAIIGLQKMLIKEEFSFSKQDSKNNKKWMEKFGSKYLKKIIVSKDCICFLAIIDSKVIGYITGCVYPKSHSIPHKWAKIEKIYIKKPYRNQTIGTKLLKEFTNWAKLMNAKSISVSTYFQNHQAVLFYQKLGFNSKVLLLEIKI